MYNLANEVSGLRRGESIVYYKGATPGTASPPEIFRQAAELYCDGLVALVQRVVSRSYNKDPKNTVSTFEYIAQRL